ncbi:MAG TPA: phosphatase PAP2 family protein [Chthoniobacterales bacterium]|jgi:membrane-associated phospholipid phosphatase
MTKRQIFYSFLVALALTLLSIFLFDQPIAAFAQRAGGRQSPILQQGTDWLEVAAGYPLNKYFLAWLALGAGALLVFLKSTRPIAWMLFFIGTAHLVIRVTAGTLKNVFLRLRPFEVIEAGNWDWNFFGERGSAFPSGHSALFWSLFFPLAFLFPRYRWPLLIIPLFISVARVGVNDHWCSDVIASIAIAALLTLAFIYLFRMKPAQSSSAPTASPVDESRPDPV